MYCSKIAIIKSVPYKRGRHIYISIFSLLRAQRCLLNKTKDYSYRAVFRNNLVLESNRTSSAVGWFYYLFFTFKQFLQF